MDLNALYHELILEHGTKPRNFALLEDFNYEAEGFNALCGDKVHLYLKVVGDKILSASFQGQGCAISMASASLLTETLSSMTIAQAKNLSQHFQATLRSEQVDDDELLGKLAALKGVRIFPARVKCATLAWHTLESALKYQQETISDE